MRFRRGALGRVVEQAARWDGTRFIWNTRCFWRGSALPPRGGKKTPENTYEISARRPGARSGAGGALGRHAFHLEYAMFLARPRAAAAREKNRPRIPMRFRRGALGRVVGQAARGKKTAREYL